MKTVREIYKESGRSLKNFKQFYNTFQQRYGINDPDEELEPEIELALMVNAGLYDILDVIIALTGEDDYNPDPPKQTATIINFEREIKLRNKKIIKEQSATIAAQLEEIEMLKEIPYKKGIGLKRNHSNTIEHIPTKVGINSSQNIMKNLQKEIKKNINNINKRKKNIS